MPVTAVCSSPFLTPWWQEPETHSAPPPSRPSRGGLLHRWNRGRLSGLSHLHGILIMTLLDPCWGSLQTIPSYGFKHVSNPPSPVLAKLDHSEIVHCVPFYQRDLERVPVGDLQGQVVERGQKLRPREDGPPRPPALTASGAHPVRGGAGSVLAAGRAAPSSGGENCGAKAGRKSVTSWCPLQPHFWGPCPFQGRRGRRARRAGVSGPAVPKGLLPLSPRCGGTRGRKGQGHPGRPRRSQTTLGARGRVSPPVPLLQGLVPCLPGLPCC